MHLFVFHLEYDIEEDCDISVSFFFGYIFQVIG